jgi:membrane fusion protein (multidrug efflux system)
MKKNQLGVPHIIALGTGVTLLALYGLLYRAQSRTNHETLGSRPKSVEVVDVHNVLYRAEKVYIGTFEPWLLARVGPQFVSAYIDTVLVRPGVVVKKGDILATLDCRNSSAQSKSIKMQARSVSARLQALAHESARTQGLLGGGFVSKNAAEQIAARSTSEQAELDAVRATLTKSSLEVDDCILRAPFDGEIASRDLDPGAFARPGEQVVSIIDRNIVRLTADVPENAFSAVAPNTAVSLKSYANGATMTGIIARRFPSADASTRTIHFEIDLADPNKAIPVGTTGEIFLNVGAELPAQCIPIYAAAIKGDKAAVYYIGPDNLAKSYSATVLGERAGFVYLKPDLPAGVRVVTEGRDSLEDGDLVVGKMEGAR